MVSGAKKPATDDCMNGHSWLPVKLGLHEQLQEGRVWPKGGGDYSMLPHGRTPPYQTIIPIALLSTADISNLSSSVFC